MQKDMIFAGGYNIYPKEIDKVLFDHPKTIEACAVGVPDEYRGETVKAFIVVRPGGKVYPSIGDLPEGIRDPQFGPCVMFGLGGGASPRSWGMSLSGRRRSAMRMPGKCSRISGGRSSPPSGG